MWGDFYSLSQFEGVFCIFSQWTQAIFKLENPFGLNQTGRAITRPVDAKLKLRP
tara:strand:- start:570 stop:731 length:162 start_codon:yes stop_codon:yes gene_type:complete